MSTTHVTALTPEEAAGLGPALSEALYAALRRADIGDASFHDELARLEQAHGSDVYAELIHILSHLRFEPDEARRHWSRIVEHHGAMEERLESKTDLRVAMLRYFLDVSRQLDRPMIIELRVFEETRASAVRDELTGLYNYRFFCQHLEQELIRAERFGLPLSVVIVDVDDFKRYNDRYGHDAGNRALVGIASRLTAAQRMVDIVARWGGEEFALILPATPKDGARVVAERARAAVESQLSDAANGAPAGEVTLSIGVATYPADAATADDLVRRADRAMYVAKSNGKNQVQLYGLSPRSYTRFHTSISGSLRELAGETHPLTTVDVSQGGLRFRTTHAPALEGIVEVRLSFPGGDRVRTVARVLSVKPESAGDFEASVKFVHVDDGDRQRLAAHLRRIASEPQS